MASSPGSRRRSQRRSVTTTKKSYKEVFENEGILEFGFVGRFRLSANLFPYVDFLLTDEEESIQAKISKYLGDGDSSGSDFEAELKKNPEISKYEEEEDDENEESDVVDEIVVEEKKKKAPSRWKKSKSSNEKIKSLSSLHDLSLSSKLAAIKKEITPEKMTSKKSSKDSQAKPLRQFQSKMDPSSQLNLSESSDSETDKPGKKV
jgi:hypothetical protein